MVTNRRVTGGDAGDSSEQTPHVVIPECQVQGRSGGADLARSNSSWARLAASSACLFRGSAIGPPSRPRASTSMASASASACASSRYTRSSIVALPGGPCVSEGVSMSRDAARSEGGGQGLRSQAVVPGGAPMSSGSAPPALQDGQQARAAVGGPVLASLVAGAFSLSPARPGTARRARCDWRGFRQLRCS
jgi:hypothetical protein